MNRPSGDRLHPLQRAHRTLWLLVGIMILAAGGITASVGAPASPLVGVGFGFGATVFAIALVLAGRVTIALERARRQARPQIDDSEPLPLLGKMLRRR